MLRELSQRRRIYAPLGWAIGGLGMLFEGLRLLFSNWRLALIQVLPAMWIWLAMLDFKEHVFHGKAFHVLHGVPLVMAILAIVVVTAASFFLNAVFAFSIANSGRPQIRPGFTQARAHLRTVLGSGAAIGLLLGVSALYVDRWGPPWFGVSMSISIGILMVAYVAVPSRMIGVKPTYSKGDKLKASAVGAAIGGVVCFPPYALGRIGILMLGSHTLFIPGVIVVAFSATLQAGATGAVKTVKMSAKLVGGRHEGAEAA